MVFCSRCGKVFEVDQVYYDNFDKDGKKWSILCENCYEKIAVAVFDISQLDK